jgi:lipopolysaccharide heptosyltransferase I
MTTVARPEGVALVKLSALGDIVHALPVAATLRAWWPDVRITWVVEQRHAGVLEGHPAIDTVVTVDTRRWRRARRPGTIRDTVGEIAGVRRRLRLDRADVAIDLQGLLKSAAVTAAVGAPIRIGFDARRCREPLAALLTNRHVLPPPAARHVVDQYLALLAPFGVAAPPRIDFRLPCDPSAEVDIGAFFAGSGLVARDRLVVLNPGAARAEKQWAPSRFAALAQRLVGDVAARVLVLWGPGEDSMARAIAGDAPKVAVAPPTTLHAMLAVLRRASVLVSADTGPLHLGAALGVPCVGLFGPTSAERNGPYGRGHRTFQSPTHAMDGIDVAPVAQAVVELLERTTTRAPLGAGAHGGGGSAS